VVEANPQRMEWDYGDGTGSMATVTNNVAHTSHAYKQPGPYRITLNVADMAGNVAKSTATVTIYGTVPTSLPTETPMPVVTLVPTPTPTPAAGLALLIIALAIAGITMVGRMKR
jgi:PKD repeat protein